MLADISGLIGLIVFVVIAIIASLLKRKEEPFELPPELKPRRDQPPQAPPPPHAQRPPPPIKRSWEEELRALLEDRPAPPPIRPQVHPVPPPIVRPATRTSQVQEEDEGGVPPGLVLRESEKRYSEAARIQQRVAGRLADVTRHRVENTAVQRKETSADARALVAVLRNPQTVRRAVLASIVLGPPKAMEG